VPAVLSTNSFFLRDYFNGNPSSWFNLFLVQILVWAMWAALTPVILWLARKVRIEKPHLIRGVIFHSFSSVALVLGYLVFYVLIVGWVQGAKFSTTWFQQAYITFFIAVFHWDFIIYWTILGVGYSLDYYSKYREHELHNANLEKQLVGAQLQALKMQLQPHFLFNTLHTIASLVRQEQNKNAVKMLTGLSDLLRYSLENIGRQEISLQEEWQFLEQYLEIQKVRFENRFQVSVELSPETLEASVPALILQPIVENAFQHGFDKSRNAQKLEIKSAQKNGMLELSVFNEGPPLAKDFESTDWKQIISLYDQYLEINHSIEIAIELAQPVSEIEGPRAAVDTLVDLDPKDSSTRSKEVSAHLGELYIKLNEYGHAIDHLSKSHELSDCTQERTSYLNRIEFCKKRLQLSKKYEQVLSF